MKVTVKQVAEAMLIDETPKITGTLVRVQDVGGRAVFPGERGYNNAEVYSCAVGGAALVLGADADSLSQALGGVDKDGVPSFMYDHDSDLYSVIYRWNDASSLNLTKAEVGYKVLDNADDETLNTVLTLRKQSQKRLLEFKKV